MSRPAAPSAGPGGERCQTCADAADSMRVLRAGPDAGLAVCVDAAGRELIVQTGLVDPVAPGQELLVHAGAALARVR